MVVHLCTSVNTMKTTELYIFKDELFGMELYLNKAVIKTNQATYP